METVDRHLLRLPAGLGDRHLSVCPTSIHSRVAPVKSRSHTSGWSGSDSPLPKAASSPPQTACSVRLQAQRASRTIMRSSVSLWCRASVSAWPA
jgi:hypothetical protein